MFWMDGEDRKERMERSGNSGWRGALALARKVVELSLRISQWVSYHIMKDLKKKLKNNLELASSPKKEGVQSLFPKKV